MWSNPTKDTIKVKIMNLAEIALNHGGLIRPLIIPSELNHGLGLMNP